MALGTLLLVRSGAADAAPWSISLARVVVAALLFPATLWLMTGMLAAVGLLHEPVGALLAGALPTATMLAGPIYLPRTVTFTRYSPLLSSR